MHTFRTLVAGSFVALGLFSHPVLSQAFDGDRSYRSGHHCWRSNHAFGRHEWRRLADRLNLTQEQRQSLYAIKHKYRPEQRDLRQLLSDNRKALAKMDASDPKLQELAEAQGTTVTDMIILRKKMRAEMEAVLTEDQRKTLHEMFERRRHHRGWNSDADHG
ncbi:MAG: Spy/CpxP family protein refolding chaperone [Thiobacillaceae bacterium]